MNPDAPAHPDAVFEALLTTCRHATKRKNLTLIHALCRARASAGGTDFSLKSIAAVVEEQGGPTAKVLWNSTSADYRKLVEAWEQFAGGPQRRELTKPSSAGHLVRAISDPATRIVVEQILRERNMLRAEVNLLKSQANITIDRRPRAAPRRAEFTSDGTMAVEVVTGHALNQLEREALEHSVSKELWLQEGWKEEKNGRVVRDLGQERTRTIFKPGFAAAVRKILSVR